MSQIKTITLSTGTWVLVEVPMYSDWVEIDDPLPNQIVYRHEGDDAKTITLPAGQTYTLIGKASELTKYWKKLIVENGYKPGGHPTANIFNKKMYRDYTTENIYTFYVDESFESLLKSQGMDIQSCVILKQND